MQAVKWVVGIGVLLFFMFIAFGLMVATPSTDAIYKAKEAVGMQLKDSGSASFQSVHAYKDENAGITVCGQVNSKNSFGALSGFSRFYSKNGVAIIEDTSGPEIMDGLWQKGGCNGVPLA